MYPTSNGPPMRPLKINTRAAADHSQRPSSVRKSHESPRVSPRRRVRARPPEERNARARSEACV
eukprot:2422159-Pyramimonas_sp.AAC.1